MNRKLSDESLGDIRAKINFLIVDETDAIKSYDDVLNHPDLTEGMKLELEEIRNEEIAHIVKLSNLLKRFATGEKSEETVKELEDGLGVVYEVESEEGDIKQINASSDNEAKNSVFESFSHPKLLYKNGRVIWNVHDSTTLKDEISKSVLSKAIEALTVVKGKRVTNTSFYELLNKVGIPDSEQYGVLLELKKMGKVEGDSTGFYIRTNLNDTNYVYETDKPNVKWRIHQSKKGGFYFADPNGSIYEENGREVWFASKESAGQFFIKKLFNKSLWGNEIPRVVVDSKTVVKTVKDSKGFVIGNNSKTEFLRWGNDKYIVAKSPDAATLYPTERSAKIALELSKFDNSKFSLFELDNDYNIKDATDVFKVGETVKVSQYGSSWKDKIRKILTREEAEKQFKSIVSGTSNEIKHWYILESKDEPVADFRISPIV